MAGPPPTLAQLRPALQLALEVASGATGPLPGRVRSLVRARRLPPNWQVTMRQALEDDDTFRTGVAARADEEQLGRLAWLWITRPEGWAEQLDDLVRRAVEADEHDREMRAAADRIVDLEDELARLLSETRSERAATAEEHDRTVAVLSDRLRQARAAQRERAAEADAAREQVETLERDNAALRDRIDHLQALIGGLRDELAEAGRARQAAARALEEAAADRSALERRYARLEAGAADARRSAGAAVARAAGAARQLGEALAEAAASLGGAGPDPVPGPAPAAAQTGDRGAADPGHPPAGGPAGPEAAVPPPVPGPSTLPAGTRRRAPARPGPGRRRPLPLPPAVFDDSPEAAEYLVRVPGAQLIVDGYNVTFTSWTGDDLPALRHRLVSALSELAVRVKHRIIVVFDGTEAGGRVAAPPVARPWLRVLFSASSVEADHVIVEAVKELRPATPVVVVTNDRQVRSDVHDLGANVLSVEQLLRVLGRQADA